MADTWHVVGQRQTERLNPAGVGFQTVWEVTYQVDSGPAAGTTGTVTVDQAQYAAEYVASLIADQVEMLHDVAGL